MTCHTFFLPPRRRCSQPRKGPSSITGRERGRSVRTQRGEQRGESCAEEFVFSVDGGFGSAVIKEIKALKGAVHANSCWEG